MTEQLISNTRENKDLLCKDLPSRPLSNIGTVLVTGASGYIGGKLVPELLARGYKVRIMVRETSSMYKNPWPETEMAAANALNREQLKSALEGIDTAYYLIHSLRLGPKDFKAVDIKAATNFREIAEEKHIKRIIYLGGLGDARGPLSPHLSNRLEVEEELKKGKVFTTVLRAAIVIGSGSVSYKIIQYLVKKLPIIPIPRMAKNKCQPIAIRDVIKYLVGVLEVPETTGKNFDIGGSDILSYDEMLKTFAAVLNKKTIFIPSPISNIRFYSFFASLFTPVPTPITQCLVEGIKNEVVCLEKTIKSYLPFEPMTFREAVSEAMTRK